MATIGLLASASSAFANAQDIRIVVLEEGRTPVVDAKMSAQNSAGADVIVNELPDGSYLLSGVDAKTTLELAHPVYGEGTVLVPYTGEEDQAVTIIIDENGIHVMPRQLDGPRALTMDMPGGGAAGPWPVDCSTGVGCQLPTGEGQGGGGTLAATSDLNPNANFEVADTFRATADGVITSLCWWGVYIDFNAGVIDCSPGPGDSFTVTFYADAGGLPGAVIAGPFPVLLANKFATGNILAGIANEYQFEANIPPVAVGADECLWVSIVNNTGLGNCFWLWETAPPGDTFGAQSNPPPVWGATDYDLAWCMDIAVTADGCGGPPPPPGCGDPGSGSCFEPNGTPNCDDEECCAIVCAIDPFCCEVGWDTICVAEAFDFCPSAPNTGACCFPDGSCLDDQTEGDCLAAGGTFQGLGTVCANVVCPVAPPNDLCANAIEIFDGDTPYDTTGANTDGAPDASCQFDGQTYNDIWYDYYATCTGELTVSTCGQASYDTDLAVYEGCDCDALVLLDCNDDFTGCAGFTSQVTVPVVAGNCYKIRIGGWQDGNFGPGTVTLDCFSIEPVGACCIDGECVDNVLESECLAMGDEFFPNESCAGGFIGYESADCGNPFEDISGTGTQLFLPDDGGEVVPIGFAFNFYGDIHTEIGVASNGYLTFGSDLSDLSEDPIPSTNDPNDLIAMLWDDLDPANAGSPATIHYQSFGDRFIVQFTDVPEFPNTGANTFQAVLYQGTNCIELRYLAITTGDYVAGIENQDGTEGVDVTAMVAPGACIQLCPQLEDPIECVPPTVELPLDIKPGSCPNSFNRNSNGVLPVALLGTMDWDITMVDISSIQISRADGIGGSIGPNEGPPGPHSVFEDVATPFMGDGCECHEEYGDGIMDLSMKFKSQDLVEALELDDLPPGDLVELCVTGFFMDGTAFVACDCIRLVPPGTPPGMMRFGVNAPTQIQITPPDETLETHLVFDQVGETMLTWPVGSFVEAEFELTSFDGQPLQAITYEGFVLWKAGNTDASTPLNGTTVTIPFFVVLDYGNMDARYGSNRPTRNIRASFGW